MKRINHIFALTLATAFFASCEGFLTKIPETSLPPTSFFKTESELELWTNKFYNDILPTPHGIALIYADDLTGTSLDNIQKGTRTPSSKSWTESTFKPLRNINLLLQYSSNCPDETVRERYNGVAYFFRAYFYFDMVRKYGDMPWYDSVLGENDTELLNKARDPRGYVMKKVLEDCDKAYERLPEAWSSGAVYHVSKDAAMALKSRAALFEGTFRKYHKGSEFVPQDVQTFDGVEISSEWFLRQAADAASKIIGTRDLYSQNTMGLADNAEDACYREYFILENAETSETILSIGFNVDLLIRHNLQFQMKSYKISATQRFVNHYLQADGNPISSKAGWEEMQYDEQFQERDPRMAQTLHGPEYIALGETSHEALSWERTLNGYRIIKYISDSSHENATTSTTDYPLFRYAEVLLNYAEAKAELGELTDADIAMTIDVIRDRVGMKKMLTVPETVDPLMREYYPNAAGEQLAAILEVRRERTVELCFEGFRRWDLFRWKEGKWLTPSSTTGFQGLYFPGEGEYDLDNDGKKDVCLYRGSAPSTSVPSENRIELGGNYILSGDTEGNLTYYASENYIWDEGRDYLYPIPADQRQLTGGALSQNPGWEDGID